VVFVKRRIVIFVSTGDPTCFEHAIMKTCEFADNGNEVMMVIEGPALARIGEYSEKGKLYSESYARIKKEGLIVGVCEDCAKRYGVLKEAKKQGLPLVTGHPNVKDYLAKGFEVKHLRPRACSCCEVWDDAIES
jgi:hypothetical protein